MPPDPTARRAALQKLEPLLGQWSMVATFPGQGPSGVDGRTVFEWALGGAYLQQRTEVRHPDAPDSVSVIDVDEEHFVQHYFDERGVTRIYAMRFEEGTWTLLRETPDFSPLDFSQRFTAELSDDGAVLSGRWETGRDGGDWELDFELQYTRIA